MDWSWLNGMAPFMLAMSVPTDKKVNRTRIVEAVVSAVVIGAMSTAAAAYVTLKIVETQAAHLVAQTAQLSAESADRGRQMVGILTQMASVQATLSGVVQQQSVFGREMHERLMALERRPQGEQGERFPRSRP